MKTKIFKILQYFRKRLGFLITNEVLYQLS